MAEQTDLTRLIELLTANEWSKRTRNSAARLLAEAKADDEIVTVARTINGRYRRNRALLLEAVAEANGCAVTVSTEGYEYQGKRLRYIVHMFGRASDVSRAETLNESLLTVALGQLLRITGENVLNRRRSHFLGFIEEIQRRMRDITALPSCTWVPQHREEAARVLATVTKNAEVVR